MRKISLVILMSLLFITGCGEKNVEGKLEDLMTKVYENIPEDQKPMMLMNTEITEENAQYYLGTTDIEFEEAIASESGVGSIAHSVVLLRVSDDADVEAVKEKIEKNANPRKWVCVEAETVEVKSKGNLIILIMSSEENAEKLENSFNNL